MGGRAISVGLIGFGAIGRQIAELMPSNISWTALVRGELQRPVPKNVGLVSSIGDLVASQPAAIVEVAGTQAVAAYASDILRAGTPLIIISVGALADPDLRGRLKSLRQASNGKLVIPSGAIGGLDYLNAIALTAAATVRYTSRKSPAAFPENARDGLDQASPTVLFDGSPEDAALRFPSNLNVAMAIALAAHPAKVTVRVVADPAARTNTHEIEVASEAGRAEMRFLNAPLPAHPRTSAITGLSVAAELRKLLQQELG